MITSDENMIAGHQTIVGVFAHPADAEHALNDLKAAGFAPDRVSVVARDMREVPPPGEQTGTGAEGAGAGAGAVLGGLTGGILGWLVGIGALAVPGIGPVVVAGALVVALGGAALGAAAGGLIGALVGMGIPEEHARNYEEHVRAGGILVTVRTMTTAEAEQARDIYDRRGGMSLGAFNAGES